MREIFHYIKSLTTHTTYPKTKESVLVLNITTGRKIILSQETSFMQPLDDVLAAYGLGVVTEKLGGSSRSVKRLYALDVGYDPTDPTTYRPIYGGKRWATTKTDTVAKALWDMTGIDPSPSHDGLDSIRVALHLTPFDI